MRPRSPDWNGSWSEPAGPWLDRPAVDAGAGEDADLPVVPRVVHGGGQVAVAAAVWLVMAAARPPGDRARRRGGRGVEEGDLAAGKSIAAERGAWLVFEDEAGQSMTPPRARTWGRIGQTPVVRVRGRGYGRGWRDFRDLIVRARIQLGGPIVQPPPDRRTTGVHRCERRLAHRRPAARLRTRPQPGRGGLVAGQARHRQPRRRGLGPDHLGRQTPTQEDPVSPCPGRWLPRRHRADPGRLITARGYPGPAPQFTGTSVK